MNQEHNQESGLDFAAIMRLAQRSAAVTTPCACAVNALRGWESVPLSLPEAQLRDLGPVGDISHDDATFEDYHPHGSNYWSADAPIALRHFPYNRCNIWTCTVCDRAFLRYTEGGGYFVDRRIRALIPELLVDAPV